MLVTDVRMPPTHTDEGLRAAVHLRSLHPRLPVLVLSQYVEQRYARELFAGDVRGLGYVLKDRVADVDEFLDALGRVAGGGTVIDPEVVAQILARARRSGLETLTPRERDVLGLMAEGRSNAAIADRLVVGLPAVEKHVTSILTKLDLPQDADDHRRVLAVLRWLEHEPRRPAMTTTLERPSPPRPDPRGPGARALTWTGASSAASCSLSGGVQRRQPARDGVRRRHDDLRSASYDAAPWSSSSPTGTSP